MTVEPNPVNPIGWLVILLLGLAGLFLYAAVPVTSSTVQATPDIPSGRPSREEPLKPPVVEARSQVPANGEALGVQSVDVVIRESAPPQVSVAVSGYWSNGCNAEPQIATAVEGSTVSITIYRIIPPDVMCTMVMQEAEIEVDITELLVQNSMRSGQFTIEVNGFVTTARF